MKKMYEVEIQRNNISPRQFFTYCKHQMEKRTGTSLDVWIDDYEAWADNTHEFDVNSDHEDWDEPVKEICRTKAYDWQFYLGKAYNFIMEFQFDTENKGYGYLYAVEFER